jgi:hypothetical protein
MQYYVTGTQLGQPANYVIDVASEAEAYTDAAARQVEVTSVVPYVAAVPAPPIKTSHAIAGFSLQRIIILAISILGIISSVAIPWASAMGIISLYGTAGDGWITLFLYGLALVATLCVGNRLMPITGAWLLAILIPSGIASLIGFYDCWNISDKAQGAVSIGLGLILVVACGVASIIVLFTVKK